MERLDFFTRANADYIDRLYEQYLRDPRSLDEGWRLYFTGFEAAGGRNGAVTGGLAPLTIGVHKLVHTYRELGHFVARLDPLGHNRGSHPLLELSQFDMTPADFNKEVGKAVFYGPT